MSLIKKLLIYNIYPTRKFSNKIFKNLQIKPNKININYLEKIDITYNRPNTIEKYFNTNIYHATIVFVRDDYLRH